MEHIIVSGIYRIIYLYENAVNLLALKWFPYGPVVSTSEIEKICIRGLCRWPWGLGKADNWWCS